MFRHTSSLSGQDLRKPEKRPFFGQSGESAQTMVKPHKKGVPAGTPGGPLGPLPDRSGDPNLDPSQTPPDPEFPEFPKKGTFWGKKGVPPKTKGKVGDLGTFFEKTSKNTKSKAGKRFQSSRFFEKIKIPPFFQKNRFPKSKKRVFSEKRGRFFGRFFPKWHFAGPQKRAFFRVFSRFQAGPAVQFSVFWGARFGAVLQKSGKNPEFPLSVIFLPKNTVFYRIFPS